MGAGRANETCREDLGLLQPAGRLPLSAPPFPIQREKPSSQSRCSQSPRPSRPCAGPPPAVAACTTSVPLNRFLLHVNTYYRSLILGEDNCHIMSQRYSCSPMENFTGKKLS
nr:uncharacterized protein LOC129480086 [Symphalangus syndactylus]